MPHIIPPDYDASQGSLSVALFKYIKMVLRPILSQSKSVFPNEEAKTSEIYCIKKLWYLNLTFLRINIKFFIFRHFFETVEGNLLTLMCITHSFLNDGNKLSLEWVAMFCNVHGKFFFKFYKQISRNLD